MGISIDAKLIYGWKYKDAIEIFDEDILNELIDDGDLDYTSPFYDSGYDRGYVGVDASRLQGVTLYHDFEGMLNDIDNELRDIISEHFKIALTFENHPALYFGPHVT